MKAGDLVQLRKTSFLQEVGGNRVLDGKRYWWYAETGKSFVSETLVLMESRPTMYGYSLVSDKERACVVLDVDSKRYFAVSIKQLIVISSVPRPQSVV